MKKHLTRTIIIYAVIALSFVLVYPTIGWMLLSPEQREARLALWNKEDEVYHKPSLVGDSLRAVKRWAQFDRSKVINLGLDLQGGVHMVIGFQPTDEQKERGFDAKSTQQLVLQTIRRRIHEFEVQEPVIQALGDSQIQIQLPGVKDPKRAIDLIMKTAYLTFHIVGGNDETTTIFRAIKDKFPGRFTPFLLPPTPEDPNFKVPPEHIDKIRKVIEEATAQGGIIPADKTVAFSQPPNPWDDYQGYYLYVMDKDALMSGEGLRRAFARPDQESPGNWQILFEFSGASATKFGEVTEKNIGRNMAIVLDGVVCGAPVIRSKITDSGSITGKFSPEQATDLAIALNSGSMPVKLNEDYTGVIGASLGADTVRKGVISSILGAIIVVIFMIYYYRVGGFIADIALILNIFVMLGALAYFKATLTLPGIAGLVLTLGMAVDSNVLIFERIREEMRNGKSLLAAIDSGYARATVTILDSNITTLIAAAVLLQFGTGPIKGFAITLSIGVCSSVFTSLVVTQGIFDFLTARKKIAKLNMMSVIRPDTKIPFLGNRRYAFMFSAAMILVGMTVFTIRGDKNFGVDFTEGTNMVVAINAETAVPVGDIRATLEKASFASPTVQALEDSAASTGNRYLIRISQSAVEKAIGTSEADNADTPKTGDETIANQVRQALGALTAGDLEKIVIEEATSVGPTVGKELRQDAIACILYGFIFIMAYLWFRFELKFAVAAEVALVHDVLITLGAFALTGKQMSMGAVAAILTIIGYSLNDTIIVFDRVREDMRLYRGRGLPFMTILDMSINQTLSRTILTSLTTLFVVVVLYFFGGISINDFAFALLVGIIIGTYSSVFVASPIVYYWQKIQAKRAGAAAGRTDNTAKRKRATKTDESPA